MLLETAKTRSDSTQNTEVICKVKQASKLRSLTVLASLTTLGILGRVAFQWVPSVEPLLPIAIGLGFYYNWKHGVSAGVSGFFLSNFLVWGFQGPWTIFQCLGAGAAGAAGGFLGKLTKNKKMFFFSLVIGTVLYEIIVNLGSLVFFPWGLLLGPLYFLAAVPFGIIHVSSSLGFGSMVYAFREKIREFYESSCKLEIFRTWNSDNSSSDSGNTVYKHLRTVRKRGKNCIIIRDKIWRERKKGKRKD